MKMNDRYLYKAKRTDNGEWVEGYLYGIWERRYILWGMTNDVPNMIEVDPSTICQRTGVPDRDKAIMYEDDIVLDKSGVCGIICFGRYGDTKTDYGFYIRWSKKQTYWRNDIYYWQNKVKVVGNIFDNPELWRG